MENYELIKKSEKSVLDAFQSEIPSVYYSDKTEEEFLSYRAKAEDWYRDLFKFPPEMFANKKLIDFGAGTGENTVYLANWGATCTLVEMNNLAQNISKDIFQKYTNNFDSHKFFLSSIFDFDQPDLYESFDIVLCRGCLSHTADKKSAFNRIMQYLKPGGYIIYEDPNKVGGFQNMLQRYTIYSFAKSWDEMVDVSEKLFKEDIDRSQKYIYRKRRTIIFDRWVVQKQDDPSVRDVLEWFESNQLKFYSSYPPVMIPFFSDSAPHQPKFNLNSFKDIGVLSEAVWMARDKDDAAELPKMLDSLKDFSDHQEALTGYVANSDSDMTLDPNVFSEKIDAYLQSLNGLDVLSHLSGKVKNLLDEARELISRVNEGDLDQVKNHIDNSKHLFAGAVGVRAVYYIAHKPK